MRLLWLHVPVIVVYGLATGNSVLHSVVESLPTAVMGFLGTRTLGRPPDTRRAHRARADAGVGGARAPVRRRDRDALPLLRDARRHQPLPGLAAVPRCRSPSSPSHHGVVGASAPRTSSTTRRRGARRCCGPAIHAFFVLCAVGGVDRVVGHRRGRQPPRSRDARGERAALPRAHRALLGRRHGRRRRRHDHLRQPVERARSSAIRPDERVGHGRLLVRARATTATAVGESSSQRVVPTGGTAVKVELRVRHRDGSYRWVDVVGHQPPRRARASTASSPTSATSPSARPSRTSWRTRRSMTR